MSRLNWLAAGVMALATPTWVEAHALGVECSLKNGVVHIEAYFEDDTTPNNARVEVFDARDKRVADGKTDAKGLWSFAAPTPGSYRVVVDAGAGHVAKTTIRIPDPEDRGAPVSPSAVKEGDGQRISEGTTKEEFTRYPWLKLGIGVSVLVLFGVAFLVARKK